MEDVQGDFELLDGGEQTVSYTLVCDHRQHCSDGSDETFCVFAECPDRRGTPISSEVNVFMAIFVLPLNSALNPFLYTLNIVLEKRRKAAEARLMEQLAKQMSSKRLLRNACTMTASRDFP
nr:hypothetical protein BaRGS_032405 [Batillaria attramentaria]